MEKENGNYRDYRDGIGLLQEQAKGVTRWGIVGAALGVYWENGKRMETSIVYRIM